MNGNIGEKLTEFFGFTKSGDDCGANGPGGGGFQSGNKCGSKRGQGGGSMKKSTPTGPRDMANRIISQMSKAEKDAALRSNQGAVDVTGFLADKMFDDLNDEQIQRVAEFVVEELSNTQTPKPVEEEPGKKLTMAEKLAKLRFESHDGSMKDAVANHNDSKAKAKKTESIEDAIARRTAENMKKIGKSSGSGKTSVPSKAKIAAVVVDSIYDGDSSYKDVANDVAHAVIRESAFGDKKKIAKIIIDTLYDGDDDYRDVAESAASDIASAMKG